MKSISAVDPSDVFLSRNALWLVLNLLNQACENSVCAGRRQVRDPLLGRKILTRQVFPSIESP
jgi:hypothetical protein